MKTNLDINSIKRDNSTTEKTSPHLLPSSQSFETVVSKAGQTYIICYALGHLYRLEDPNSRSRLSPVYDPVWKPLSTQRSNDVKTKFLKFKVGKILKEIEELSKNASEFIHACDYDQEGEVIGHNILQFACKNRYEVSKRAKFSSLTDEEILNSFNNLLPPNHGLKDSGISRHIIDFFYGINISRALSKAVNENPLSSSTTKTSTNIRMSIGRVQGPTLAFVVERELEISDHVPVPYWNIHADFLKYDNNQNITINTTYFPERIDSMDTAMNIVKECKGKTGIITLKKSTKTNQGPPTPFNLGDLQREAFKQFGFTPSYTLAMAEKLYLSALISYPRTSSQKLPSTIEYKNIITKISKFEIPLLSKKTFLPGITIPLKYAEISKILLTKKNLQPKEGRESDPAHPSIYPTGEKPKKNTEGHEARLLDLIIRRFFAVFGENASVSRSNVTITVKSKHLFKTDEKKIIDEGWIKYYIPYFDYTDYVMEEKLSSLREKDILLNTDMSILKKTTQPPSRYNQSTLLQKMEKENIGTKATRSEIINILLKRKYIFNFTSKNNAHGELPNRSFQETQNLSDTISQKIPQNSVNDYLNAQTQSLYQRSGLKPTKTGIALINSMKEYAPDIISTTLTRALEQHLSGIETGQISTEIVLNEAKVRVSSILQSINSNKQNIGKEIKESLANPPQRYSESKRSFASLGDCPVCKKGRLMIKISSKSKKRFAGCSNYLIGNCTATAPLPSEGTIKKTKMNCSECKWPIVMAIGLHQNEKSQWKFCINNSCPLKKLH